MPNSREILYIKNQENVKIIKLKLLKYFFKLRLIGNNLEWIDK